MVSINKKKQTNNHFLKQNYEQQKKSNFCTPCVI